jgi:tRNA (mo5U34)-methyltransferase
VARVAETRGELPRDALERDWYHTIELAPGIVTPGWFDTRGVASGLPWPETLAGMRCLDVATSDGFWAFEMERRGAADVVAIDVLDPRDWDWPTTASEDAVAAIGSRKAEGRGFDIAHRALGSSVRFEELSVYDLEADRIGTFEFVYVGSLLLHLRDPLRALERIRAVCTGQLLLVENIDIVLTRLFKYRGLATFDAGGRPWWWKPNVGALVHMLRSVGFELERPVERVNIPAGPGHPSWRKVGLKLLRIPDGRHLALTSLMGDPHAAILARPVTR